MKLKFIRPVIAFCLTITLAFNSVSLAFAAPEDSDDLPLEIQQQQQERLLKLLPGFYEKIATYYTELTRESNHKNLTNEISELKEFQEKQKAVIDKIKSLSSFLDVFIDADNSMLDAIRENIENTQLKLQELEKGQEQLQKLLEFSTENNQKQLQKSLEASLKELKNEKMDMESNLNMLQDLAKSYKWCSNMTNSMITEKVELPKLVELFYEINNNNDYCSATYAQNKAELLKSLQDIIQELQRQEVERLQYQCNKQK